MPSKAELEQRLRVLEDHLGIDPPVRVTPETIEDRDRMIAAQRQHLENHVRAIKEKDATIKAMQETVRSITRDALSSRCANCTKTREDARLSCEKMAAEIERMNKEVSKVREVMSSRGAYAYVIEEVIAVIDGTDPDLEELKQKIRALKEPGRI